MRRRTFVFLSIALLVVLPVIPVVADALATIPIVQGGGAHIVTDFITFFFTVCTEDEWWGNEERCPNWVEFVLTEGAEGTTVTVSTDQDPEFGAVIAAMTDGEDGQTEYGVLAGGLNLNGARESDRLGSQPGSTNGIDLQGTTIGCISLHIDSIVIDSPGSDLAGDGIWTDYHLDATLNLLGACVQTDIKPGGEPNSINLRSKGIVPVAVLTSDDFDATTVDPATVSFAGAPPVRWAMEDVDSDGDIDLLFHFKTQELNLDMRSSEATLTGETFGGLGIEGTDSINIVLKGG